MTARPTPLPDRATIRNASANDRPVNRPNTAQITAPIERERDARDAVGVVGERHREQQRPERRERDEGEEAAVREVERVADVGGEDAERGLVELAREVQADQHDQRQQRFAAADLVEELARGAGEVAVDAPDPEQDPAGLLDEGGAHYSLTSTRFSTWVAPSDIAP